MKNDASMERVIITITENGVVTMPTAPVWMTQQEMSDAFNVFGCHIRKAVHAIYKNMELLEEETMRHVRQNDRICYDVYSLEMVIAVAFRLRSREAMAFRKFIMKRLYTASREMPVNLFFSLSVANPRCTC
jgi:hypothetical protein